MCKRLLSHVCFAVACASIWTAESANIDVDCGKNLGVLIRYEQHATSLKPLGAKHTELVKQLKLKKMRLFKQLNAGWHVDAKYFKDLTEEFIFCIWKNGVEPDQAYGNAFESQVKSLKNLYPQQFTYCEVDNEPSVGTACRGSCYYKKYSYASKAVDRVNASLPAGVPKIKVGGPTEYTIHGDGAHNFYSGFMDYVKTNNLTNDFISWHSYTGRVYAHMEGGDFVKQELDRRGMKAERVVTEWKSGGKTAAGTAAGNYFFLQSGVDIVTHWTLYGHHNDGRNLLAPTDGEVYPSFCTMLMMAKHNKYRIEAISDGLTKDDWGNGIGAVASMDETGIAVLVWNYWYKDGKDMEFTLNFKNMPSVFNEGQIELTRYSPGKTGLTTAESKNLPASTAVKLAYPIKLSDAMLIVLKPSKAIPPVDVQRRENTIEKGNPQFVVNGNTLQFILNAAGNANDARLEIFGLNGVRYRVVPLASTGTCAWDIREVPRGLHVMRLKHKQGTIIEQLVRP
jgi:hypothetical protein